MKKIEYLKDMYRDGYFPNFLVDKIKVLIEGLVSYLEEGEHDLADVQSKLDEMVMAINDLQDEFDEHDSEIETVARESIAETVEDVLIAYQIDIDIETAIGERDW